jgi:hypothetical protein
MAAYQSSGNDIGSLLRMIAEEKSTQPVGITPQAESGTLMREMVQTPVYTPESSGTARVTSIKPEMGVQPSSMPTSMPPPAPPVAPTPTIPNAGVPMPTEPIREITPTSPNLSENAPQPQQSPPSSTAAGVSVAAPQPTNIYQAPKTLGATVAKPQLFSPAPWTTSSWYGTPSKSSVGNLVVKNTVSKPQAKPTPTPAQYALNKLRGLFGYGG